MTQPSPSAQLSAFVSRFPAPTVALAKKCLPKLRSALPGSNQIVYDYSHSVVVSFSMSERGYEAVVALAYPTAPAGENVEFTVMYQRGEGNKDGTLVAGQSVKVKDGMVFDVTPTDKS